MIKGKCYISRIFSRYKVSQYSCNIWGNCCHRFSSGNVHVFHISSQWLHIYSPHWRTLVHASGHRYCYDLAQPQGSSIEDSRKMHTGGGRGGTLEVTGMAATWCSHRAVVLKKPHPHCTYAEPSEVTGMAVTWHSHREHGV